MGILRKQGKIKMTCYFIIPDHQSFVSGGNIYNTSLFNAFRHIGSAERMNWETYIKNKEYSHTFIFDSLYLKQFEEKNVAIPKDSFLLLHYLDVFYEQKGDPALVQKRLEQLKYFYRIVVTGVFTKQWLLEHKFPLQKTILIEPSIYTGSENNCRLNSKGKILMVGNLIPVKGYSEFLDTLALQQPANIEVTILGDETIDPLYSETLKTKIKNSLYLTKTVRLAGTVTHIEVFHHLNNSNLFISASNFESFGMAVHEALQNGLPVYAINNGNLGLINHPALVLFSNYKDLINAVNECLYETKKITSKENKNTKTSYSWYSAAAILKEHLIN